MMARPISLRSVVAAVIFAALSGCGTYVPEIQENPLNPPAGQLLVKAIVGKIRCDLQNAVIDALGPIDKPQNLSQKLANFMSDWGILVALTLNVEEKGSLSPNAVVMPTSMFGIGLGVAGSADATRKDTFNFFYTVASLRGGTKCPVPYDGEPNAPHESFLLDSNLKIDQWLKDEVTLVATNEIGAPLSAKSMLKQTIVSHEVKFEVITSGSANPAWKLVNATVDQSGNLLGASRDRTHDMTITFGPLDPTQNNQGLIPLAETIHTTGLYGNAFGSAIRSGRP